MRYWFILRNRQLAFSTLVIAQVLSLRPRESSIEISQVIITLRVRALKFSRKTTIYQSWLSEF